MNWKLLLVPVAPIAAALLLSLGVGAWGVSEKFGLCYIPAVLLLCFYIDAPNTAKKQCSDWRVGFRRGYWFGLLFFGISLSWLHQVFPFANIPLAAYLALYLGVWGGFSRWMLRKKQGFFAVVASAAAWAALEWLRGWVLTGFGWNGLAVAERGACLAFAPYIGGCGVSGVLLFIYAGLLWLNKGNWNILAFMVTRMVAELLHAATPQSTTLLEVLLVQPNVTQQHRWDVQEKELRFATLSELEQTRVREDVMRFYEDLERLTKPGGNVGLVVWPESALHYSLDEPYHEEFLNRVCSGKDFVLVSGVDIRENGSYTGAVAAYQGWQGHQRYRKTHLVPFGEYLPFRKELPFMQSLFGGLLPGDFDAGKDFEPIRFPGKPDIIPNICFEDSVSRVIRNFVRPGGPQVIVNMTNDGWFKESAAANMHLRNARLRCVELCRPMVRAGNTGVTAVINTRGEIESIQPFQQGTLQASVPIPKDGPMTLYARFGDWFACCCLGFAVFAGVIAARKP
jgi:apolipoprotein N-acyltransferase